MSKDLSTYGNFKVNHLFGEGRHLIAEAELVLSNILCREDIIALPFILSFQDFSLRRVRDFVVDIERATRLDLTQVRN